MLIKSNYGRKWDRLNGSNFGNIANFRASVSVYGVTQPVSDLGWVDLDISCACPILLGLMRDIGRRDSAATPYESV